MSMEKALKVKSKKNVKSLYRSGPNGQVWITKISLSLLHESTTPKKRKLGTCKTR